MGGYPAPLEPPLAAEIVLRARSHHFGGIEQQTKGLYVNSWGPRQRAPVPESGSRARFSDMGMGAITIQPRTPRLCWVPPFGDREARRTWTPKAKCDTGAIVTINQGEPEESGHGHTHAYGET